MKSAITLAAASALLLPLTVSTAHAENLILKKAGLFDLYSRYAKNGYAVDDLPEFGDDKLVLISGTAISHTRSMTGDAMLIAGEPTRSKEGFARLSAYDDEESKKMDALPAGSKFKAICSLDLTSGTRYIGLSDCVFKQ